MFDWFKPKKAPEGPVTFDFETEIEAPASEIYALVDFADPRNAKRQMGHSVKRGEVAPGTFILIMKQMPEVRALGDRRHRSVKLWLPLRSPPAAGASEMVGRALHNRGPG